jgi:hypothetical protein
MGVDWIRRSEERFKHQLQLSLAKIPSGRVEDRILNSDAV